MRCSFTRPHCSPDPQDIAALLRHGDHGDDGDDETAADPVERDRNVDSAADIEAPVDLNDKGAGTLDDHESAYGIAAE